MDFEYDSPFNSGNLRVIRTARTEKAINKAVDEGFRPLVKPVVSNPNIHHSVSVYQHKKTGKILLVGDLRLYFDMKEELERDYECVVPWTRYYQYYFENPYAAYLIPPDLKEGERVWLEDIIEDIVSVWGNQDDNARLEGWEATWDGKDFTVHFDPESDAAHLIG